jgi:hypothetical protein
MSSHSTDSPYLGIRSCHLILNPCLSLGSSLDPSWILEFLYQLHFGSPNSHAVVETDSNFIEAPEREMSFSSERKFYRRRKSVQNLSSDANPTNESTPHARLSRYLFVKSDPLVINIAEQEAKIIFRWLKHTLRAIPNAFSSLNINVSKIQSAAFEMNLKIEKFEYLTFMTKLFKKLNITSNWDELVPIESMTSIFDLFLKPLHLTTSEFEEHRRQLFLFFDKNLDRQISVMEFEERGLELYTKKNWRIREDVPLKLCEYSGVSVNKCFFNALHDTESLNEVWKRIEYETPLRRSWDTLQYGITPFLAQSLLVRVCEDAKIAKFLWENVIRINFTDPLLKIYPWYASDDTVIASRHSIYEHAREIIGNRKIGSIDPHYSTHDYYVSGVSHYSTTEFLPTKASELSQTVFDISLSTIQLNFIDNLLGPKMPRYQMNISSPSFHGTFSHDGLAPKLSFGTSNLITDLRGSVSIESSFFNSIVGAHEPLIEPFTFKVSVAKSDTTGSIKVDFHDEGPLVFNISTTLMQTLAAFVISLEEICPLEFDDDDDSITGIVTNDDLEIKYVHSDSLGSFGRRDDLSEILSPYSPRSPSLIQRAHLSNSSLTSPLILIHNLCGVTLSVSLCISPHRSASPSRGAGTTSRVTLSELEILPHAHAQINAQWELISKKYGEHIFPVLVFSVTLNMGSTQHDYFRLYPLHSLSTEKIFIPLASCQSPSNATALSRFVPPLFF